MLIKMIEEKGRSPLSDECSEERGYGKLIITTERQWRKSVFVISRLFINAKTENWGILLMTFRDLFRNVTVGTVTLR